MLNIWVDIFAWRCIFFLGEQAPRGFPYKSQIVGTARTFLCTSWVRGLCVLRTGHKLHARRSRTSPGCRCSRGTAGHHGRWGSPRGS